MIEAHPEMVQPSDDAILWRFMDFTKYVALLNSRQLYFTQAKRMEDNYEGVVPKVTADAERRMIESMDNVPDEVKRTWVNHHKHSSDLVRQTCCLSCWHMNLHESAAMWKLYMKTDEGVSIRTTFAKIKSAFANTPDIVHPAVVKYIDYTSEGFSLGNLFRLILHKRKSFEHEAEVRLIWWFLENHQIVYPERQLVTGEELLANAPPGRPIQVALTDLIQEVYVSPTSAPWFRELVENVTRKYDIDCPVIRSDLYTDPVW